MKRNAAVGLFTKPSKVINSFNTNLTIWSAFSILPLPKMGAFGSWFLCEMHFTARSKPISRILPMPMEKNETAK